jgi:hypothetical protein
MKNNVDGGKRRETGFFRLTILEADVSQIAPNEAALLQIGDDPSGLNVYLVCSRNRCHGSFDPRNAGVYEGTGVKHSYILRKYNTGFRSLRNHCIIHVDILILL